MEPQGQAQPHGQPIQPATFMQVVRMPLIHFSKMRMSPWFVGLLFLYLAGLMIVGAFALLQWMILAVLLVAAWPLALPILIGEVVGGWMLARHHMRATSNASLFRLMQAVGTQLVFVGAISWGFTRRWMERRRQETQQRQAARVAAWQAWQAHQLAQQRAVQEAAIQAQRTEQARLKAMEEQRKAEAERIRQAEVMRLKTLNGLLSLTPKEFERAVGVMLVACGCSDVRQTGGAGDLAADLTCFDGDGNLIVVQCKRYAPHNLVGSPEVQMFIGMAQVHHRAHRGLFVTTSDFTEPAKMLAQSNRDFVMLVNGELLTKMMQRLS